LYPWKQNKENPCCAPFLTLSIHIKNKISTYTESFDSKLVKFSELIDKVLRERHWGMRRKGIPVLTKRSLKPSVPNPARVLSR
jgi:hypothetical protein